MAICLSPFNLPTCDPDIKEENEKLVLMSKKRNHKDKKRKNKKRNINKNKNKNKIYIYCKKAVHFKNNY